MAGFDSDSSPKVLRRIAALLVRSPEAGLILDDLDELLERDLTRGLPPWRAQVRYVKNMLASAFSVRRAQSGRAAAWKARLSNPFAHTVSWLDFKLGFRMLVKYPGLTLVGFLAISVAIAVGAAGFQFMTFVMHPRIPLDEADRIVVIENVDVAAIDTERHILHDFVVWRTELESVEHLSAYRDLERNLVTEEGSAGLVWVAEISASAFRVARVPPLLGRYLVEADEEPGAPPVVVIGHDLWQRRFAGDPGVVGQAVQLGTSQATVIGVMPEGFAFPANHNLWTPLRLDPPDQEPEIGRAHV